MPFAWKDDKLKNMLEKSYNFEEPGLLSVVAVGVPGKRTFFLVIGEKENWIRLWLEKEHLEAVSIAIDQFFVRLSQEFPLFSEETATRSSGDDSPVGLPSGEFEIDQVGIGFDKEKVVFEFMVHALGPQNLDGISVNCWINPERVRKLGKQAKEICAAGRPRCKLCGRPIDPMGHDCPMQN
ncbi:MAG: DUF3090 family protein [Dehalococcoidales bacterium]|nr:MAG: DUF3090 family protein [Dehalococcoidales bacterium]